MEKYSGLLEKDIEDTLYHNPCMTWTYSRALGQCRTIIQWTDRQLRLPSGVADLVGIAHNGQVAIVEVKRGKADGKAISQVIRYKDDFDSIMYTNGHLGMKTTHGFNTSFVVSFLCAERFSPQTLIECMAADIIPMKFCVRGNVTSIEFPYIDRPTTERPEWSKLAKSYHGILSGFGREFVLPRGV